MSEKFPLSHRLNWWREGVINSLGRRKLDAREQSELSDVLKDAAQLATLVESWVSAARAIPICVGYQGNCDGDLDGQHEPECSRYKVNVAALGLALRRIEDQLLAFDLGVSQE